MNPEVTKLVAQWLAGNLKSKTSWFNIATSLIALTDFAAQFLPPTAVNTLIVVNVVNFALRQITSSSIFDKGQSTEKLQPLADK